MTRTSGLSAPLSLPTGALLAALLAACGSESGTTATDSNTGSTGTGTTAEPTTSTSSTPPTTSASATDSTAGSASMTDSGTTTATATGTDTSDPTATVGDTEQTGTTTPVQTDTGTTVGDTTIGDTTVGDTTDASGSSTGDTTTGGVEPACACPDIEVALDDGIFVLSDNSELYKFYPETNQFEMLGAFKCGNASGTFSMAVDRLGFAWVMFSNPLGKIWKLDVTNVANCSDPGYQPGQQGVNYFGMAFVSNSQFDQCDKLYGNTFNGFGGFSEGPNFGDFLTVDPDTLVLDKVAKTTFNGAEMTGTGDGRVFMFGGANPAKLVEVDKLTGQYLEVTPLGGLELTNAFAFSFFAGDFYMFTESNNNPFVSKVTHYDYDGDKALTTVVQTAPIRIVGAGVSTCAPFLPM